MVKRKAPAKAAANPAKKAKEPQANNLLWETFSDTQVTVEDVAEGMARIVAYDSDSVEQVVLFLGKLAGLKGSARIAIKSPAATAKELEKLCDGAVASYPLATAKYGTRFANLMRLFLMSLQEAQSEESLEPLVPILGELAQAHLRSLRHVATAMASEIQQAAKQLGEPSAELKRVVARLDPILKKRMNDVSPQVRVLAVKAADFSASNLDDDAGEVRAAALGQATWSKLKAKDKKRVEEIAARDVDLKCRLAAVQILDDCSEFLADPSPEISAVAARRFLETNTIQDVENVSVAGATALAELSKLSVDAAAELVAENPRVFELLPGACEAASDRESLTAILVEQLHILCTKFTHDNEMLAKLFALFKYIDFDAVVARNLEDDTIDLFKLACDIYCSHPDSAIQHSFAYLVRPLLASPLSAETRTQLHDLLEKLIMSKDELAQRASQVAELGRFIDISAFASDELWDSSLPAVEDYAQNTAFHGDAEIVQRAIEYLKSCKPQPDEKLMRVLIAAKIRDVQVRFNVAKIRLDKVSKATIAAAAAAAII